MHKTAFDVADVVFRGPLADIQPCKGYKWLGNWSIRIKKGITDDDG